MRTKLKTLGTVCMLVVIAAIGFSFGDATFAETEIEGDAKAGEAKAAGCTACHGKVGISTKTNWPNLAGQQEGYLVKSIKDFRDGIRTEVTMQNFMKDLTDQDVADLAAYYTGLSPCP